MATAYRRRMKAIIGKQSSGFSKNVQLGGAITSERASINSAIKSAKRITDAILDIFDQFEGASEDILLEALEPTLEKAKYYCPVDTGELVASGYLEKVGYRGKPRVEIGFAKAGKPYYGAYVHEMTHIPHEPPTRSKFLQAAVMEDLHPIYIRIADRYKEMVRG